MYPILLKRTTPGVLSRGVSEDVSALTGVPMRTLQNWWSKCKEARGNYHQKTKAVDDDQSLLSPPKPVEVIPVSDSDDDQTLVLISSEDDTTSSVDNDDEEITSPDGGGSDSNDVPSDEDRASHVVSDKLKRKRKRSANARSKTYRKWIPADVLKLVRTDGKLMKENFGKTVAASKLFQELQPLDGLDLNVRSITQKRRNLKVAFQKKVLNGGHPKRSFYGERKSREEELYECCLEAWPHIELDAILNGSVNDDDLN